MILVLLNSDPSSGCWADWQVQNVCGWAELPLPGQPPGYIREQVRQQVLSDEVSIFF